MLVVGTWLVSVSAICADAREPYSVLSDRALDASQAFALAPAASVPAASRFTLAPRVSMAAASAANQPVPAAPGAQTARAPVVFERAQGGGIDATTEALAVPRFNDVSVQIDGRLDEAIWASVPVYDNMTVISPDTLSEPVYETRSRFFYTDDGFYVSMHSLQPPSTLIARLSSRDAFISRDGVSVTLDPSGTGLYGYYFGINLGGSLSDGTIQPERSFSRDWDGPWRGATAETDDGWTAEIFVPWSTMPMPASEGERKMGLYLSRTVGHLDESWSWPALPFSQPRYLSVLQPIRLRDVEPRQEFSAFAYSSATFDNIRDRERYRAGVDLFWRPWPGLQVTATANPDFGNVEADDVVVNLTAFETFFPEKRLFFLEGVDIFETGSSGRRGGSGGSGGRFSGIAGSGFRFVSNKLVHMRRIGARPRGPDLLDDFSVDALDLAEPSDLIGAGKVTGQAGSFRYGALMAFEDDTIFDAMPDLPGPGGIGGVEAMSDGRDFAVVRGLWENTDDGRRSIGLISTLVDHPLRDASVLAVDMTRQSPSGAWDIGGVAMASNTSDAVLGDATGYGIQGTVIYRPSRGVFAGVGFDYFDDELDFNDFGFMRRNDIGNIRSNISFNGSNIGPFRTLSTSLFGSSEFNTDGQFVDSRIRFSNSMTFKGRSSLRASLGFNPSTLDDRGARGDGVFRIEKRWGLSARFESDASKKLAFRASLQGDQEDLGGWRGTVQFGLAYALSDRVSVVGLVDYVNHDGWLLYQGDGDFTTFRAEQWKPKLNTDIFFSATQQLRFSLQWAGVIARGQARFRVPTRPGNLLAVARDPSEPADNFAISNLTLQVRYRWQIAPLSDLFVVYTRASNPSGLVATQSFGEIYDEAFANPLTEGLVVKLRYRFGT